MKVARPAALYLATKVEELRAIDLAWLRRRGARQGPGQPLVHWHQRMAGAHRPVAGSGGRVPESHEGARSNHTREGRYDGQTATFHR
jgi:hypothetical protein